MEEGKPTDEMILVERWKGGRTMMAVTASEVGEG